MKYIIFSFALAVALHAQGQTGYTWTTSNANHTQIGSIHFDSVSFRSECSYSVDSAIFYYSGWTAPAGQQYYTFSTINGSYKLTDAQLDSCNGVIRCKWNLYGQVQGEYYLGINGLSGIDICDAYAIPLSTSITTAFQQNKPGTVTIYDIQGRYVKTSQVVNYTETLTKGQFYIYNTIYSDGSIDKGKFIIE